MSDANDNNYFKVNCGSFPQQYDHNNTMYNQIKEELCFAYLSPICAYIGAEIKHSGRLMDNTGVDVTISLPRGEGHPIPLHLDVQLKGTSVPKYVGGEYLSYQMDRTLFDDMSTKNKSAPWLLFVLILPQDVERWVFVEEKRLITCETMLWYDATGQVAESDGDKITVRIPLNNRVNKDSLYRLLMKQMEVEE